MIENLAQETASHWRGIGGHIIHDTDDPELRALTKEALRRSNEEFGQEQAQKARGDLTKAIADSRALMPSSKLTSITNLRDKHLAHSLTETNRERKTGPFPPMQYGDERDVLNATLPIVETLYCWVNGTSFSFEDSRQIDRKNAQALWQSCTFNITR